MSDKPKTAAIEVENLSKTYREGLFSRRLDALRGVTLHVSAGQIFGLLGPNGAGKTTLIKILLGIIRKTGGDAWLLGHPAGHRAGRLRVGYLPEHLRMPPHHTALSALDYYGRLSGMSGRDIRARSQQLLLEVGLPADRHRDRVKKYSKGMLQRLGLAQALLHDPDLLILDEPTDGLDPVGRRHVRDLLGRLRAAGKTIFLNSHLLLEVEMVCDRVAILNRGQLRGMGTPAELAERSHQGLRLRLLLSGAADSIRSAVQGSDATITAAGDGLTEVALTLADQAAVDQCIDQLRQRAISIVGLSRQRATLEDTFLALLDADRRDDPGDVVAATAVESP
ncbi:MAG: ABC transporter ATP-binding protein [Pirellulaceae bacterium]|nr:ABC transporter ATP-binding protein [Pirellulaceae bacterium]